MLGAVDDGADDEGAGGDDDQHERGQSEDAACTGGLALEGRLAATGRLALRARTTKVAGHAADCAIPSRKVCVAAPSGRVRADRDLADPTGFEPAISSVTGWHVGPLHHGSVRRGRRIAPDVVAVASS